MSDSPYVDLAALPAAEAMAIARPPMPAFAPDVDHITTGDVEIAVEGGSIALRTYRPAGDEPRALIVHLHGGGWVTGSLQQEDARCKLMARAADSIVVSVGYRLSPEVRFPVPVDDCLAAWDWAERQAGAIGGDAHRMAISGSSAGGQLAVAVLLMLKAQRRSMPRGMLLTYPALDPALVSPSYTEFADGPFMTRARMAWYWDQYKGPQGDRHDPRAAVLTANLSGLPPAFVQVAELDVLRDEAIAFAEALRAAGGTATVRRHQGMVHGFIAIAPDHAESHVALVEGVQALKEMLA